MDTKTPKSIIGIINRLQKGEKIACMDCEEGYYTTPASDVSLSREFRCNKCKSVVMVSPNIIVE